jgi:hypothetical protein
MEQNLNSDSRNQDNSEIQEDIPWVERNGFAHWAVAFGWVLIALIAFNIVGAIVGVAGILLTSDNLNPEAMM